MRKLSIILALTAALLTAGIAMAATFTVSIKDNGFVPKNTTVTAGDTVTWKNDGKNNHQVVATTGAFASPVLRPGQSFSFKFTGAGTVNYRDALNPSETGSVIVKAPPPPPAGVSITESQPIVIVGSPVRLAGAVSTAAANQTIEIYSRPYPQSSFQLLTTVKTVTGGFWDYVAMPPILTTYYARWVEKKVDSGQVTEQVRPRLSIAYNRLSKKFTARSYGLTFKSGRSLSLQRLTTLGAWVNVKTAVLGPTNSAVFTATLPVGAYRYRLYMSTNQAGAGFLGSWSGTLLIGIKPPTS